LRLQTEDGSSCPTELIHPTRNKNPAWA
jgi:hypothetical protein